ncbi:MAG: ADP-ribosylation factor-like protein [Promethearchaeota archaeon]
MKCNKVDNINVKVVMLGRAGVGKTTLKKIFFERANPLLLLKNSLEPTIGAESNLYDMGLKLAVHDLAGQELNSWLDEEQYVFDSSDVIFIILDSSDDWDGNIEIHNRLRQILQKNHVASSISLIFHKVDLLTNLQFENLKKNIAALRKSVAINVGLYFSSIKEEFILDTFHAFVDALKIGLCRRENCVFQDYLVKLEILKYFKKHKHTDIEKLEKQLHINPIDIIGHLKEMYKDQTLVLDPYDKETTIGSKGAKTLETLEQAINPKIKDILLSERDYIKGVIISDKKGIPFYTYEHITGFFKTLISDQHTSSEPGIISMFFAQIVDFAKTMDYNGLTSFQFGGYNLKITSYVYKGIMIIFFIDRINLDQGMLRSLEDFLRTLVDGNSEVIQLTLKKTESPEVSKLQEVINNDIQCLDVIIKSHHQNKTQFTKKQLLEMYINLAQGKTEDVSAKKMQSILFQYLIMESPESLQEI